MRQLNVSVFVGLVLLTSLVSCGRSVEKESVERSLLEADRAFASETALRGLDGWLAWFDEHAAVFPRDRATISGLERIRTFYQETGFDPAGLTWEPERAVGSEDGTLGMTYGTWYMNDGDLEVARGKYVTVWQKTVEGKWRVVADMGNSDIEPVAELDEGTDD